MHPALSAGCVTVVFHRIMAKVKIIKLFITILCFITTPLILSAQVTAEEIENLLNTEAATYGQASRFVLEAANILTENNEKDAFSFAVQNGWLPANLSFDDPARLDHISRLLTRSFDTGGGIMYSFTKNSHYAYRELVYLKVIQGRADPTMIVSGERLIFYINRIFARQDALALSESKKLAKKHEKESAGSPGSDYTKDMLINRSQKIGMSGELN